MLKSLDKIIIAALLATTFILADFLPAGAQLVFPELQTGGRLDLSISPAHPRSFSYVNVILDTSSADPASSQITWYVDGRQVASGIGIKEIRIQTGDVGAVINVNVVLRKSNGDILEESIIIRPSDVDLMWESDTTVPPFYKGKPLHTFGSPVRLFAMPRVADARGNIVPPEQLVYKWTQDGRVRGLVSGYGRMSYFMDEVSPTRGESIVLVEVSTVNGVAVGLGAARISPEAEINVVFYEADPLLGVNFDRAIDRSFSISEDDEELALFVQPYFFFSS
jgi:hypothetical protein